MSSTPPSISQSSGSIWTLLNKIIGLALAAFVLYFGLFFVIGGISAANRIRNPQAAAPAPAAAAAPAPSAPAAGAPAAASAAAGAASNEVSLKPDAVNPMAFSTKEIHVKAGQAVKLTFENAGATVPQPHNFVIGKAGTKDALMAAAMKAATDPQGMAKSYIPEDPAVLAHTKLLMPGTKETIEFTLPAPGDYPYICSFPGHSIMMNGVMKAE